MKFVSGMSCDAWTQTTTTLNQAKYLALQPALDDWNIIEPSAGEKSGKTIG